MAKPDRTIPLLACKKILLEQGAIRISDDALVAMRDRLDAYVQKLTNDSLLYTRHAKRTTVMGSDVQLALRQRSK